MYMRLYLDIIRYNNDIISCIYINTESLPWWVSELERERERELERERETETDR